MVSKLTDHYIKVLSDIINQKLGLPDEKIDSLEGVLDNIHCLAKIVDFTDDSNNTIRQKWLPAEYKRMLLYIIFDGKAFIKSAITEYVPGQYAIASATITDGSSVFSTCEKRVVFDDVLPFVGYSDTKRNMLMQSYALGGAESKALTYAGIGMEFCGDIKEYSFIPDAATEAAPSGEGNFDPEIAQKMNEVLEEKKAGSSEPATTDKTPVENTGTPGKSSEPASDDPVPDDNEKTLRDLEEIIRVPFGAMVGKLLCEIPKPAKIAGWLYAHYECGLVNKDTDPDIYANVAKYVELSETAQKAYKQTLRQYEAKKNNA